MNEPTATEKERAEAVASAMADIRAIEADQGVTRAGVEAIRDRLIELSKRKELFGFDDFAPPENSAALYRLSEDEDGRFALYLNASNTSSTPSHNHTTWAVVVGVEGQELNRFYRRLDGDQGVVETGEHMVEYGTGVAMLADDLHSIHIDAPSLNFHCYGLALERLDAREYYSESSGRWKIFPPSSDIREARHGLQAC